MIVKRLWELAALLMIGDGMVGLLQTERHLWLWERGPERYRELMTFKARIARAIADSVAPVLLPAPDASPPDRDAAVEVMLQRLLSRLSGAYEVDAIVQVPVRGLY